MLGPATPLFARSIKAVRRLTRRWPRFSGARNRGEELTAGALAGSGYSSPTHSSPPVSPLTNDEGAVGGVLDHPGPVEREVAQPGATKNEVLAYRPESP